MLQFFKFSGAGNDFVVLDGRRADMTPFRDPVRIGELCRKYRTDGLMILTDKVSAPAACADASPAGEGGIGPDRPFDFVMEFYNPDGSGGMMCGNGGRCIVAFADYLGIRPADGTTYRFLAPDGEHTAEILSGSSEESSWTVRLKMIDVQGITPVKGGYFLNTGTRHFVKFVEDLDRLDMEADAKPLRWDAAFQPEGTNVNFVAVRADGLHVRTFEKGVEGETLACGTGLTASALAAFRAGIPCTVGAERSGGSGESGPRIVEDTSALQAVCPVGAERPRGSGGFVPRIVEDTPALQAVYRLQCRRGDWLQVDFRPGAGDRFTDVYLIGPACMISK